MTRAAGRARGRGVRQVLVVVLRLGLLALSGSGIAPLAAVGQEPGARFEDDLFLPMLAAPREVSSYFSVLWWEAPTLDSRVASMGVGDAFPFARWGGPGDTRGRLAIEFGVLAQFDLDGPSFDFVNADFFVGVPLSLRLGEWSARARFYHWSAHLGDEFLLSTGLEREEISVESIELLISRDLGPVRLVGGGVRRLRRFPKALGTGVVRAGVEFSPERPLADAGLFGRVRPLAGVDLRWTNPDGWATGYGLKAGIEVSPSSPGRRGWSLVFELFDGRSPYGQFFRDNLRFIGIGLHLR